jgi:hypothetical protein
LRDEVLVARAAEDIADGRDPDWEALDAACADGVDRTLLRELRALAAVANVAQHYNEPVLQRWGRLIVLERIGAGTFGEVFRAWDPQLERPVALKLFSRGKTSPALAEARRLARVRHAGIPIVFGVDENESRSGFWMELIEGDTLASVCARSGPLGILEAGDSAIAVADALAAVHQAGLLHGDIKPQNIVRGSANRVVLTDFGLGRDRAVEVHDGIGGTPLYLAPELLAGHAPSVPSDIYALGVTLYFLLTCTYPVTGGTLKELLRAHGTPRHLGPRLPGRLAAVLMQAIEADPARRPQSAEAFRDALASALRAFKRGRQARWGAAALLVALGLAALIPVSPSIRQPVPSGAPSLSPRPSPARATEAAEMLATGLPRRRDPFMTSLAALGDPALRSSAGTLYSVQVKYADAKGASASIAITVRTDSPLYLYAFTEESATDLRLIHRAATTPAPLGAAASPQHIALRTPSAAPAILLISPFPLRELEELARQPEAASAPSAGIRMPAAERALLRRLVMDAERAGGRADRWSDALRRVTGRIEVVRGVFLETLAARGS